MDNIEFWIYIIFALIYFIGRGLRSKPKPKPGQKQPRAAETEERQSPDSMTFDELLEEITGKKSLEEKPAPQTKPIKEAKPRAVEVKPPPKEKFEEGRSRKFADEESRRVYEESIRRAASTKVEYEPDKKFAKSKLFQDPSKKEVERNPLAEEIQEMLQSPESARKAIILQEILNRKY